jgi:hypothetical protein
MIDLTNLNGILTNLAETQAKKKLIDQYPKHVADIINTPWLELCEDKISTVTVNEDIRKYYKENYEFLLDFFPKSLSSILPQPKTIDDLDEKQRKLFSEIPAPFLYSPDWKTRYEDDQKILLKLYLEALSENKALLAKYLLTNMKRKSLANPKNFYS